jgi:transcriptional regulator with XRE-family HTH domain
VEVKISTDMSASIYRCVRSVLTPAAELGRALNITPNTISRWGTGGYKPSIADLQALANFFGIPISQMIPQTELSAQLGALLSAAKGLEAAELHELIRYALFKRARTSSRE